MISRLSRRQFLKTSAVVVGFGSGALVLAACGGGGGGGAAPTTASTGKTFNFELTADDSVAFSQTKLSAEAGSKIVVKFTNKSSNKQFNWVLAKPGRMLRVNTNGQIEGEASGYVKPNDEDVVAHTKLLKPGESDEVTFDAPGPGDYQYFCTFPGFYTRMNGLLTIK
jgi:azurin